MALMLDVLPADLPILRLRFTLRLLQDAPLPAAKGPLLRGGFGYAFQEASCPPSCWRKSEQCHITTLCPYRWVFETPRPPDIALLHDLKDIPRPFVFIPPTDGRTFYNAGETLEFAATLIGRGTSYVPFFIQSFIQLGAMGLGRNAARARLERVEALLHGKVIGPVLYQEGRASETNIPLPLMHTAELEQQAMQLPAQLIMRLVTPLRVKAQNDIQRDFDFGALVRSAAFRISALSVFHSDEPWRALPELIELASEVAVRPRELRWVDIERISTRGGERRAMPQGGLVGEVELRNVPAPLRALLLLAGLVHVGKACTFGNGGFGVRGM
jgi:hypothetical protein